MSTPPGPTGNSFTPTPASPQGFVPAPGFSRTPVPTPTSPSPRPQPTPIPVDRGPGNRGGGGTPPPAGGGQPPSQGGGVPVPTGPTGNPAGDLSGSQRDAYSFLVDTFQQFGLASLAPTIFNYIKQGYGADTITLLLQDTPEYKARFSGNEIRAKAGLGVLSPAQYLATESSYRAILANAGLPKSFYDTPDDFAQWIGGDVSPTELQGRVTEEQRTVAQAPQEVKQALTDLYGVSEGDMVAYFLDQQKSLPLLQLQAQAAQIGGQALMRGLSDANAGRLAQLGISTSQAQQGYSQIGESLNTLQQIAQRFGTNFSQTEAENALFTPNAVGPNGQNAFKKQQNLEAQEKALFSGNTGAVSYIGLNAGSQQQ